MGRFYPAQTHPLQRRSAARLGGEVARCHRAGRGGGAGALPRGEGRGWGGNADARSQGGVVQRGGEAAGVQAHNVMKRGLVATQAVVARQAEEGGPDRGGNDSTSQEEERRGGGAAFRESAIGRGFGAASMHIWYIFFFFTQLLSTLVDVV